MKNIIILVLLGLGLQEIRATKLGRQLKDSVCANKDNVMVAMPGSCAGFFFCVKGNAIAGSCGIFYQFNPRLGICDHPQRAGCNINMAKSKNEVATDQEAEILCETDNVKNRAFGKSQSCVQFYVCNNKEAIKRVCPPQKHFNAKTQICQDIKLAQCIYAKPLEMENSKYPPFEVAKPQQIEVAKPQQLEVAKYPPLEVSKPQQLDVSKLPQLEFVKPQQFEVPKPPQLHGAKPPQLHVAKPPHLHVAKPPLLDVAKPVELEFAKPHPLATAKPLKVDTVKPMDLQTARPITQNSFNKRQVPDSLCSRAKQDSIIPHPWDCGLFVYCVNDKPMVMNCPNGLHFSLQKKRCEWPAIAKCVTSRN